MVGAKRAVMALAVLLLAGSALAATTPIATEAATPSSSPVRGWGPGWVGGGGRGFAAWGGRPPPPLCAF